jgi:hypothetical protein
VNQSHNKGDDEGGGSGCGRDRGEAWRDNILAHIAHGREDWKEHFSQRPGAHL